MLARVSRYTEALTIMVRSVAKEDLEVTSAQADGALPISYSGSDVAETTKPTTSTTLRVASTIAGPGTTPFIEPPISTDRAADEHHDVPATIQSVSQQEQAHRDHISPLSEIHGCGKTSRCVRSLISHRLLSRAFEQANNAVSFDNALDVQGAGVAYKRARELVLQALHRAQCSDNKFKILCIRDMYLKRIEELKDLKSMNHGTEKTTTLMNEMIRVIQR